MTKCVFGFFDKSDTQNSVSKSMYILYILKYRLCTNLSKGIVLDVEIIYSNYNRDTFRQLLKTIGPFIKCPEYAGSFTFYNYFLETARLNSNRRGYKLGEGSEST